MSLKDKAQALNKGGGGVDFMEGREKGDLSKLFDTNVVIDNIGSITDKESGKDYAVFTVKGNKNQFFFGGSVITDKFAQFDESDIEEIQSEGLPARFTTVQTKNGKRNYTNVEFYPDAPF